VNDRDSPQIAVGSGTPRARSRVVMRFGTVSLGSRANIAIKAADLLTVIAGGDRDYPLFTMANGTSMER
jgi:hypothetical protein